MSGNITLTKFPLLGVWTLQTLNDGPLPDIARQKHFTKCGNMSSLFHREHIANGTFRTLRRSVLLLLHHLYLKRGLDYFSFLDHQRTAQLHLARG